MLRLLIIISFFFAGFGLAMEHLVIGKCSVTQSLAGDEDSPAKDEPEKNKEETDKEEFLTPVLNLSVTSFDLAGFKPAYNQGHLPSGFADKPFTPPDLF